MKRIAELRSEMKISQKELAEKLDIAQNTLSQYERGTREPDAEKICAIAKFFDVTTDYLLGKTDERKPCGAESPTDDLRAALFGGGGDVTDEMWEEVKKFAEYVKIKYKK